MPESRGQVLIGFLLCDILSDLIFRYRIKQSDIDHQCQGKGGKPAEDVTCIDIGERKVVSDDSVRDLLLSTSEMRKIAEFRQLDKPEQKTIIRRVMQELRAGPRQMSRVTGMSYNIVQNIGKQSHSI